MMQRSELDAEPLLREVAAWPELPQLSDVSRHELIALSRRRGIDFATALLFDRVRNSPTHGGLLNECTKPHPPEALSADVRNLTWAIVPGAFYREHPETGADGASLRSYAKEQGIHCEVVPTQSFGTLDVNTTILQEWLGRRRDEPLVLISLSKGSLEVRRLLERREAASTLHSVRAWINLAGILSGSPLVQWLLKRPWRATAVRAAFWWKGYDFNVVRELDRTPELVNPTWSLPRGMDAIHVVGFALNRHLSSALMRRGHRRLAEYGPNDGAGIVLADIVDWPGMIYPVWGADHYLRTSHDEMSLLVTRVLNYLDQHRTSISLLRASS